VNVTRGAAAVVTALTVAACGTTAPSHSPIAVTNAPHSLTPTPTPIADPCVLSGQSPPAGDIAASYPTALAFAPDGRLFYAERSGTVRVWQGGANKVFASVPVSTSGERGLLGLAISPTFAQDRFVYAFYSDANGSTQHVIRWRDCAGTGMNPQVLLNFPAGGDCCHKGGRIAFGADGKLYVTLGEEHNAGAAQNTSDVRGKLLRYNPDGSIPTDNPFGAQNAVWAYGLRNPFGIAVSSSGQIAITNNGPSGDAGSPVTGYDTLIESAVAGGGYQWPLCYGYSHPLQGSSCGGQHEPDWSSEASTGSTYRTYVPTGATFVDANGPAGIAGHLVFCTFNHGMLVVTAGSPHATVIAGPGGCRLDVKEGPDHALYFSDTGSIHRMA
jgi:glucose/arabinose dehydrogenase